jgi:hypothetical protein
MALCVMSGFRAIHSELNDAAMDNATTVLDHVVCRQPFV